LFLAIAGKKGILKDGPTGRNISANKIVTKAAGSGRMMKKIPIARSA
jgi:hypothetical protein